MVVPTLGHPGPLGSDPTPSGSTSRQGVGSRRPESAPGPVVLSGRAAQNRPAAPDGPGERETAPGTRDSGGVPGLLRGSPPAPGPPPPRPLAPVFGGEGPGARGRG